MPFKKNILCLCLLLSGYAAMAQYTARKDTTLQIPIVTFDYVEKWLQEKENDTVYVINFWATWCKPCVKELPYITALEEKYADKKVKVYLVSLDFKKYYQRMVDFLIENNISTEGVLLNDPDANSWIDKVDKSWSGAIPATVIFKKGKRAFYEQEFSEQELKEAIEAFF